MITLRSFLASAAASAAAAVASRRSLAWGWTA